MCMLIFFTTGWWHHYVESIQRSCVFWCEWQIRADAHVLAIQPQDASLLPGDHQQHQGGAGAILPWRQLLLQRWEQATRHWGARRGSGEHREHSAGPCLHPDSTILSGAYRDCYFALCLYDLHLGPDTLHLALFLYSIPSLGLTLRQHTAVRTHEWRPQKRASASASTVVSLLNCPHMHMVSHNFPHPCLCSHTFFFSVKETNSRSKDGVDTQIDNDRQCPTVNQ